MSGAGYVGILSVELHFPEAGSLKGKRKYVKSAKAQLQQRFGAAVAEVDHHDLWQRSRLGTIAGCMVTNGLVRRGANVRVVRDGTVINETSIAQLKRFKDDAREVAEGFECGILLEGFNDLREGDIFEAFETREVERTSLDEPAGGSEPPRADAA